jgi:aspartyl-tRNA(Asn)/glutamyl-tRNA(Gln) amidotransferase subunit A
VADKPLHELSIADAGVALRQGRITSTALTEHALARIKTLDPKLNAFITVTRERALADAAKADADFKAGRDRGPFQGIPYGLKDIYDTAGIRTTCHSKLRADVVPKDDSVVAAKLENGGGVLLGKLATHEFAIGGPSFDLPFPPARNPWNLEHIPGGSSSGSAAAVAAGLCRMAMGSDTGGSIRGPAAWCGLVGHKPTYGLVSRRGVFPLSYTLDHCGPLTWTVEDAAITMELLAGHDARDPASARVSVPEFRRGLGWGVQGLRIGLVRHFYDHADGVTPEVIAAIDNAAKQLARAGAIVEDVTLPDYELFNSCGRIILTAEAYAVHEHDFARRPLDYGQLTYLRLMIGTFLSASDLVHALRLRRRLTDTLNRDILTRHDALLTATTLAPAPRFDEIPDFATPAWPIQTLPWNLTGSPALSMPAGFTASKLPLAVQIVGRPFEDPLVLRIGAALEKALALTSIRPAMAQR